MIVLSEKQKEFWRKANHRWNIKQGAVRSGKTYLDYFLIPRRIRACGDDGLIVLIGNTRSTLNRNIIEPMRNIWGDTLVGQISNDGIIQLFGRRCHVIGADKASQAARLQGTGIAYCYGDEITTWNPEVFSMLQSRLDKPQSCFDGTCNPDHPNHWFKQFLDSDADIFQQHYTIDDNPFNSPDFVENLKKEYQNSVFYARYILGEWALAEGLVYPMFSKERHVISAKDPIGEYYISIDYGTVNPTSMGLWCVQPDRAVRVAEFYHDSRKTARQLTDEEYYKALEQLAGEHRIESVVIDPSAASFITLIRRHGRFLVKKAKNEVLDGIRLTGTYLQNGKLLFDAGCCDSIREFGAYCWDQSASEDKVCKQNDHAMDEIRYFCNTILRRIF